MQSRDAAVESMSLVFWKSKTQAAQQELHKRLNYASAAVPSFQNDCESYAHDVSVQSSNLSLQ